MRRLPRLHPVRWVAAAGQAIAVLMVGTWSAWMTYLAAPRLATPMPDWWMAACGGVAAVVAALAGLVCARVAGAQAGRRPVDGREVPARYPAAVGRPEGRHRAAVAGRRPDGWREINATPAAPAARRTLDSAAGHRPVLPAGTQGSTWPTAVAELEWSPDGVDLADGPAAGPDDPPAN